MKPHAKGIYGLFDVWGAGSFVLRHLIANTHPRTPAPASREHATLSLPSMPLLRGSSWLTGLLGLDCLPPCRPAGSICSELPLLAANAVGGYQVRKPKECEKNGGNPSLTLQAAQVGLRKLALKTHPGTLLHSIPPPTRLSNQGPRRCPSCGALACSTPSSSSSSSLPLLPPALPSARGGGAFSSRRRGRQGPPAASPSELRARGADGASDAGTESDALPPPPPAPANARPDAKGQVSSSSASTSSPFPSDRPLPGKQKLSSTIPILGIALLLTGLAALIPSALLFPDASDASLLASLLARLRPPPGVEPSGGDLYWRIFLAGGVCASISHGWAVPLGEHGGSEAKREGRREGGRHRLTRKHQTLSRDSPALTPGRSPPFPSPCPLPLLLRRGEDTPADRPRPVSRAGHMGRLREDKVRGPESPRRRSERGGESGKAGERSGRCLTSPVSDPLPQTRRRPGHAPQGAGRHPDR